MEKESERGERRRGGRGWREEGRKVKEERGELAAWDRRKGGGEGMRRERDKEEKEKEAE